MHLLGAGLQPYIQARWNSSSTRRISDQTESAESSRSEEKSQSSTSSGPGFGFGFQSLSGLFRSEPPKHAPSVRVEVEKADTDLDEMAAVIGSGDKEIDRGNLYSLPVVSADPAPSSQVSLVDLAQDSPKDSETTARQPTDHTPSPPASSEEPFRKTTRRLIRKFQASDDGRPWRALRSNEPLARHPQAKMDATATASNQLIGKPEFGRLRNRQRQLEPRRPWGLSVDRSTSNKLTAQSDSPQQSLVPASSNTAIASTSTTTTPTIHSSKDVSQPTSGQLTHVKTSGEARMVDVGSKAATRRVAIANATVFFTNMEPFRLIFENTNKKGDVLSVSRIAGITSAKRTSDLIPLCHPIAITKTEVDAKLEAPADGKIDKSPLYRRIPFGAVTVQALIECVGPTGVEMEALTAANVAALTVYDMCKAVDRKMHIGIVKLLYKSGGRSGTFVNEKWAAFVGKQFFSERGLDVPDGVFEQRQ